MVQPRCEKVEIGDVSLECVDEFCYLGDKLCAVGGAEESLVVRVRSGWKKFRELLPLLTLKGLSLHIRDKLYASYVRSVMLYGSEAWAVKEYDVRRLMRNERSMLRWMTGGKLSDRMSIVLIRE